MKIRVDITIEIDAPDYVSAAEHQLKVQEVFAAIKREYGQAALSFRQMRAARRETARSLARRPVRRQTGQLAAYQEVGA